MPLCIDPDYVEFDFHDSCDFVTNHAWYYPFNEVLAFTRPKASLNLSRVADYVACIERGERPVALTLTATEGWCHFVLDGHHKLHAYKASSVGPRLIQVCRLDAPAVSDSAFQDLQLDGRHPLAPQYRKVKSQYRSP